MPRDAIVAQLVPGSPAAAAGLALDERIVAVEGLAGFAESPQRECGRLVRCGQRPDGSTAPLALRVRTGTAGPRAVQVPLAALDEYLASTERQLDGGIGCLELPGVSSGPRAASDDDTLHERLDDPHSQGMARA